MSYRSYQMREYARTARRWLEDHGRTAAIVAAGVIVAIIWCARFIHPFKSRDMVILYRPSADGSSVVFSLGAEYKLHTIKLIALDGAGKEAQTLWRFQVPGDAPKLNTFTIPPRAAPDNPPPHIEPGKPYRLRVSAAGARGTTDFTLNPNPRRAAG